MKDGALAQTGTNLYDGTQEWGLIDRFIRHRTRTGTLCGPLLDQGPLANGPESV
jgi:hypothetical protein